MHLESLIERFRYGRPYQERYPREPKFVRFGLRGVEDWHNNERDTMIPALVFGLAFELAIAPVLTNQTRPIPASAAAHFLQILHDAQTEISAHSSQISATLYKF